MVLFYDPDIYGWSTMSNEVQALCRTTVFYNIRKNLVLYVDGVPMHTTNESLDVTGLLAWTLKHQHLFQTDFKMLVAMKNQEYGIHLPMLSFTFRAGKWTMLSHSQMREALIPDKPPRDPFVAHFVTQMGKLTIGKSGVVPQRRSNSTHTVFTKATRLSNDSYLVVSDIHPGIHVHRPDVAAILRAKLTGQALPVAMQNMLISTCNAEYEIVRTDMEISVLPLNVLTEADLACNNRNKHKKEKAQATRKQNRARATSSRKASPKTVFVTPSKARVVRMTLGEALDMLAVDGRSADYHNICPKRTSRTIAGSYRPVLQCTKTMRTAECRARRDKALACAILRQRKQTDVADYDMAHRVPISLAYALASGCARQVANSASASDRNRRLDDWLPLKTGVVLPQHQQFLPKSSRLVTT